MQLRDLVLYVLVACGILPRDSMKQARELTSKLLKYAQESLSDTSVEDQRHLVHELCIPLGAFIKRCEDVSKDTDGKLAAALKKAVDAQKEGWTDCKDLLAILNPLCKGFQRVINAAQKDLDDGVDSLGAAAAAPRSTTRPKSTYRAVGEEEGAAGGSMDAMTAMMTGLVAVELFRA